MIFLFPSNVNDWVSILWLPAFIDFSSTLAYNNAYIVSSGFQLTHWVPMKCIIYSLIYFDCLFILRTFVMLTKTLFLVYVELKLIPVC